MVETVAERTERRAGDDRDHELLFIELAAQLAHHRREDLRLHREHDDVGVGGGLGVRSERLHAIGLRQLRAAFAPRPGDENMGGRHEVSVEEAAHHRLGHGAAADERQTLSGQGHGRKYAEV